MRSIVWIIVVLQVVCAAVFIASLANSIFGLTTRPLAWEIIEALEILASIGLVLGAVLGVWTMRAARVQSRRAEDALRSTSGAFADVIESRINGWGLSPAERDVAWLLIKGFSTAEVADIRGKREGTIKAQSTAIYRKAGVSSRAQLLAGLVEDLLDRTPDIPVPVAPDPESFGEAHQRLQTNPD